MLAILGMIIAAGCAAGYVIGVFVVRGIMWLLFDRRR
jgi:hypothetical protein